jgi:hypothetical protein
MLSPVLSPPDPVVVLVMDIGAIVTAPPKLTIPPEIVPIVIPSRLTAAIQTLLPLFFIICTSKNACLNIFINLEEKNCHLAL